MKQISTKNFEKLVQILKKDHSAVVRIASGSMDPLLKVGEHLKIVPVIFSQIKKFDIIVFWNGSILICHYVWHTNRQKWGQENSHLVTRSFKGGAEDFPISEKQVVGVVHEKKIPLTSKIKLIILAWWTNK